VAARALSQGVDVHQSNNTVFARIGGPDAVRAVVDDFYQRVLGDPALAPAFRGVDMLRLRNHQLAFLTAALGGRDRYEGRSMKDAHRGLGITKAQFAGVAAHLHAALRDFVPEDEIEQILVTVASLQREIVER